MNLNLSLPAFSLSDRFYFLCAVIQMSRWAGWGERKRDAFVSKVRWFSVNTTRQPVISQHISLFPQTESVFLSCHNTDPSSDSRSTLFWEQNYRIDSCYILINNKSLSKWDSPGFSFTRLLMFTAEGWWDKTNLYFSFRPNLLYPSVKVKQHKQHSPPSSPQGRFSGLCWSKLPLQVFRTHHTDSVILDHSRKQL